MRRRDTIIAAVIVNAALLMILFATAMRSDGVKEEMPLALKQGKERATTELVRPARKEILNETVASVPTLGDKTREIVIPIEEEITLQIQPAYDEPVVLVSAVKEEGVALQAQGDESYVNVTVKKGDFLEKIAKANSTTVAAIMKANKMSSTQLKIGQVLKIPLSSSSAPAKETMAPSRTEEYYIVKDGDNPWLIATRNKMSLEELLRLNDLDEQKARRLRPGDKLKIR